jgi:hypothetical protein
MDLLLSDQLLDPLVQSLPAFQTVTLVVCLVLQSADEGFYHAEVQT